ESYQQVLGLEDPETWNELARSYLEIGNYEQAIHFYEKSLKKDPTQLKILKEIATLYKSTQQFEKADELFEKIEKLELIYQKKGEHVNSSTYGILQETLDFIMASQKMAASNGALIQGMPWEEVQVVAVTDPNQQVYKQLIEYLEKILLFNPEDRGTLAKLASIYKKTGNKVKFEEYLQRLRALDPQVRSASDPDTDEEIDLDH
ncbi:MAG: tetratricopeptide repeat protein, partial [Candidatus Odinarchaeota archaeon]